MGIQLLTSLQLLLGCSLLVFHASSLPRGSTELSRNESATWTAAFTPNWGQLGVLKRQ